jgi:hypothetical protein
MKAHSECVSFWAYHLISTFLLIRDEQNWGLNQQHLGTPMEGVAMAIPMELAAPHRAVMELVRAPPQNTNAKWGVSQHRNWVTMFFISYVWIIYWLFILYIYLYKG